MAATLQSKCSGGIIFVIITKTITKIIVPRNYFVIVSARMVHHPAPVQNFSLPKKWWPQRKDFGGRYGFPGFHRVFVSTTDLESFFFEARKVPQMIFFRWWSRTLFSSLKRHALWHGRPVRTSMTKLWSEKVWTAISQKAADVWKKDVWDFQAPSQTFLLNCDFP